MAALGVRTVCSGKVLALGGGVSLPEVRGRLCQTSVSGNWLQINELKQRSSALPKVGRGAIISELDDSTSNSRKFKSIPEFEHERSGGSSDSLLRREVSDTAQLASSTSKGRVPPRFATLRSFGEAGGDGVVTGEFEGTSVFELIAANIEASKQVKNWEVLSGRLAMLALSVSLGVEILTGNSVFTGIDAPELEAAAALCAFAFVAAGGFAFAWRAKADVVTLMSKGYKNMVESALDSVIEGLFFDEP